MSKQHFRFQCRVSNDVGQRQNNVLNMNISKKIKSKPVVKTAATCCSQRNFHTKFFFTQRKHFLHLPIKRFSTYRKSLLYLSLKTNYCTRLMQWPGALTHLEKKIYSYPQNDFLLVLKANSRCNNLVHISKKFKCPFNTETSTHWPRPLTETPCLSEKSKFFKQRISYR